MRAEHEVRTPLFGSGRRGHPTGQHQVDPKLGAQLDPKTRAGVAAAQEAEQRGYALDGFARSALSEQRFAQDALAVTETQIQEGKDVEAGNERELHEAEVRCGLRPSSLKDVLEHKAAQGHDLGAFFHIHKDRPVVDANREMCRRGIGCLLVDGGGEPLPSGDHGSIVGVITERDYQTKIGCGEARGTSATLSVAQIMTPLAEVCFGHPSMSIYDAAQLMLKERFRHLPVVDKDVKPLRVHGVISQGDIMAALVRENLKEVTDMTHYIYGDYSASSSDAS